MTQTISNPVPAPANLGGEPGLVPVTNLVSNPWQPRRNFDINKLIELAEDIRLNGLLSPVVVRPVPGFPDMFEIAAGERRWRAFQLLVGGYELSGPATEGEDGGLVPGEGEVDRVGPTYRAKPDPRYSSIPVLVRQLTNEGMMRAAISENSQRKDVSPMEEALAFRQMLDDLKITQTEFGQMMGLKQSTISNRMRLLQFPQPVQDLLLAGKLNQWDGMKLLEIKKRNALSGWWVEKIAREVATGRTSIKYFDSPDNFQIDVLRKFEGVFWLGFTEFSVATSCANCGQFQGDPLTEGRRLCANRGCFDHLQQEGAAKRRANEREQERRLAAQLAKKQKEAMAQVEAKHFAEDGAKAEEIWTKTHSFTDAKLVELDKDIAKLEQHKTNCGESGLDNYQKSMFEKLLATRASIRLFQVEAEIARLEVSTLHQTPVVVFKLRELKEARLSLMAEIQIGQSEKELAAAEAEVEDEEQREAEARFNAIQLRAADGKPSGTYNPHLVDQIMAARNAQYAALQKSIAQEITQEQSVMDRLEEIDEELEALDPSVRKLTEKEEEERGVALNNRRAAMKLLQEIREEGPSPALRAESYRIKAEAGAAIAKAEKKQEREQAETALAQIWEDSGISANQPSPELVAAFQPARVEKDRDGVRIVTSWYINDTEQAADLGAYPWLDRKKVCTGCPSLARLKYSNGEIGDYICMSPEHIEILREERGKAAVVLQTLQHRPEAEIEKELDELIAASYNGGMGLYEYQGKKEALERELRELPAQPQSTINVGHSADPLPTLQSQPMQILSSSKNDGWRTPLHYIEAAREVFGGTIDLDPASSVAANAEIKAEEFITKEENGLYHPWHGRVWLNPPYGMSAEGKSNQALFSSKLVDEYRRGRVTEAILLVNLYFGYGWFGPLRGLPMCLPDHRIAFIDPVSGEAGDDAKASSAFIYFGDRPAKFYQVFCQFGFVGQLVGKEAVTK